MALHRLSLRLRPNWRAYLFSSDDFLPRFSLWYAVHIELECPPGAFVFSSFLMVRFLCLS